MAVNPSRERFKRDMSVNFEEKSGAVPCNTSWGSWYQTMEEVFVEVNVPVGTRAKEVKCTLGSKQAELCVKGQEVFKVGEPIQNQLVKLAS